MNDQDAIRRPQPPPLPGEGDVWAEVIDEYSDRAELVALFTDRRQFGIDKYGTPLQMGNGRDPIEDLRDEILDGIAYAHQAGRFDIWGNLVRLMLLL